ncbi:hypothetical protein [uncultured Sphingomonas sp.]|uniref:hypothetical protein n=1 Tax=uncultured Sphingomonas sp. TaxID=158754 RepID=UPI0025DCFC52|nr:hypothetical protein [uncultured Sphingomonas sp.]
MFKAIQARRITVALALAATALVGAAPAYALDYIRPVRPSLDYIRPVRPSLDYIRPVRPSLDYIRPVRPS